MSSNNNGKQFDETFDTNSLDVVIAEYIRACESGQPPDRDELLARHPDLADELRSFFANRDQMVADGLVWVGTNNGNHEDIKSVLKCVRQSDGKLLSEYVSPQLPNRVNDRQKLSASKL